MSDSISELASVSLAASRPTPQVKVATASDRALLPLDSNRLMLPQMQQIKARFNQGCVGGTKCQFFAFCWMSGGSLGASCGLLMTCCVTPSRQEIQPGFYGPVVNDPCKYPPHTCSSLSAKSHYQHSQALGSSREPHETFKPRLFRYQNKRSSLVSLLFEIRRTDLTISDCTLTTGCWQRSATRIGLVMPTISCILAAIAWTLLCGRAQPQVGRLRWIGARTRSLWFFSFAPPPSLNG